MSTQGGRTRPLLLLLGAVLGMAGTLALLRRLDAVEVTGGSMRPTLLPGDRLLIESFTLAGRPPRVGEVVLAPDPREPSREIIKRVTAAADGRLELRGDAPEASTDSRTFGSVESASVRWRVALRYWPPERFGPVR